MMDHALSPVAAQPDGGDFIGGEADTRSVEELEEEIAELCTHIDAATYRLLRAIAEFDRREAWGVGFPSTAHWLSWRVGIDLVTAREKVRVARALEGLPRISEAFRQGKVSYSKVRAITRIGSPENEEYLLYIAENGTACHMEALVRAYRRACRGDDPQAARRQREERYLEMYTDDDGMVVIRGRLPQEIAALLEKALEGAMDALEEKRKKGETRDRVDLDEEPVECACEGGCKAGLSDPRLTGVDSLVKTGAERLKDDSAESCTTAVSPVQTGIPGPHVKADPAHDSAESSRADCAGMARDSAGDPEDPKTAEKGAPVEGSVRSSGGAAKNDSAESPVLINGCYIELSAKPSATGTADRTLGDAERPVAAVRASVQHDSAESWRLESIAQRRVDALGLLAEAALGEGLTAKERGEPFQVMIHVDADVLAGRSDDGRCELETGDGISAEACRRLACDAPHVTVGQDADGNVLHLGRKARKISTPLWRALMSRDRTCRFPGCARTRHLQAHHIEHWARGGETNPWNLLTLCRGHHWAVHEGGVRVEGRAPHGLVFRRPDGSVLPDCPVPVPIHGEAGDTLKQANRRHGLEITANTVESFWDGEEMDLHMAVDGLLSRDDPDPVDEE